MQFFKFSFLIFLLSTSVYAKDIFKTNTDAQLNENINNEKTIKPRKLSTTQTIGKQLFEANCQKCHGIEGKKKPAATARRLSDMTSEQIYYSFKAYSLNIQDHGGNSKLTMQTIAGKISLDELEQIISYVKNDDYFLKRNYKLKNTNISDKPTTQGVYIK